MSTIRQRSTKKKSGPSPSDLKRAANAPRWAEGPPKDFVTRYDLPMLGKDHYGDFTLKMAGNATILAFEEVMLESRSWGLCLFVLSNVREIHEERKFILVGTGDRLHLPELWNHVGTKQSRSGYVWHLFEVWPETGR